MNQLTSLILAARGGNLDAFGDVVERFQAMARAVAYAMLGDAHLAEDAAQEAFIEAYLCLPKLREPAAFPGWFRRIVVKRADRLIRGKPPAMLPLTAAGHVESGTPDPAVAAEARELQRLVHAQLAALPELDRLMTALFYLGSYSQQEIATIVELPVTTVKKRLYHIRQRLRERMEHLVRDQLQERRPAGDEQFARLVQFFIAVRLGDLPKVRAYLTADPQLLNAHERWDEATARQYGLPIVGSYTPLHRAAFNGDQALLALLLEQGADANATTRAGLTPLHIAVLVNWPEIVAQLLAGVADPNRATDCGMTPLHWAVMHNRRDLAALLLAADADRQVHDRYGRTPLDWARLKGHEDMVTLLHMRQRTQSSKGELP
jgi:RNA polymerase sigma factor (sigma-70 family)